MPDNVLPGKRVIKRFRVAREGQTIDGRTLSQEQIIDMAETYDPVEYTARINCEHMSGRWSSLSKDDGALGDVIKLDAQVETFKQNGIDVQLMCLYATLSALPVLVDANKEGKKIFTSIEFFAKFADTNRAYLVGLAVTDQPASRGTEPLKFNRNQDALCTDPNEQELVLMTIDTPIIPAPGPAQTPASDSANTQPAKLTTENTDAAESGFLNKLGAMFASKKTGMSQQEQDLILQSFAAVNDKADEAAQDAATAMTQLSELQAKFDALNIQLSTQPATDLTNVPPTSGAGAQLTAY